MDFFKFVEFLTTNHVTVGKLHHMLVLYFTDKLKILFILQKKGEQYKPPLRSLPEYFTLK